MKKILFVILFVISFVISNGQNPFEAQDYNPTRSTNWLFHDDTVSFRGIVTFGDGSRLKPGSVIIGENLTIGSSTLTSLFNVGTSAQFQINSSGKVVAGEWNGTVISPTYGGTGLTSLGSANQLLRVNGTGTSLEYFTPSYLTAESDPVWITDKPSYLTSATASSTYTPLSRNLTINGTTQSLSADRTWTLTTTDITEGLNQYFTDERAQDAVGGMVNSSLTYTDGTPLLSISDGDKGDITTSTSGTSWSIDAQNSSFWSGKITDEVGTGSVVFGNANTITIDGTSTALGGSVTTFGFTITITGTQNTIADGTPYYMGAVTTGTGTTDGVNRIYIPVNCVLKSVYGYVLNGGTLGSGESGTYAIRKNSTTDVSVSSSVTTNSVSNTFSGTGLSTSYVAGDYIEGGRSDIIHSPGFPEFRIYL